MTDLRLEVEKTSFLYDFKHCPLCGEKLFYYGTMQTKVCTANVYHCEISCEETLEEDDVIEQERMNAH